MLGMSAPIFISYSSRDRNTALTICQALENRGLSCWISCRDIGAGENFQVSIVRAIRAAKVMVLVFSANSNNSEEIKKELVLAGQSQLIVIPVRVEDITPDEAFAYELATRQWIDLFSDWEGAIERLVRQLAAMGGVAGAAGSASNAGARPDSSARVPSENGTGSFRPRRDKSTLARAGLGSLRYFISASVVLVIGVAAIAAWYWRETPAIHPFTTQTASVPATANEPAPTPASLADLLSARFASAIPGLDQKSTQDRARAYEAAPGHKAQAASLQPPGTWRTTGRPDADNAEEANLEQCQVVFGQPCVLLAVDQDVKAPPTDGKWKARDMPRTRYAGDFDPEKIPGLRPENRNRRDIRDYRSAEVPKAAAYLPNGGRVFTVVVAATQRAAEEQALKACNDEATLNKLDGTCLLYAVGDRVVLPLHLEEPVTAPTLGEILVTRLASVVPKLDAKSRTVAAREFEDGGLHKAQAGSPEPPGWWSAWSRPTAEIAQDLALESCQIYHGQPCILVATDNVVEPTPRDGKWLPHDMPRVRYAGSYDPRQIPSVPPAVRERSDVLAYGSTAGPKAAALHLASSRLFLVTKAASQRAAEEQALAACNDDPNHQVQRPCFLYAIGDQVVLPRRAREPLTAPMSHNPALPAVSAPLREMLSARLASAVPALDEKTRAVIARDYEGEGLHKAEAASLEPAGTWRSANRLTSEIAEELALEDCQIYYGQPCTLLATDNTVEPTPGDGKWPRHDMPRVRYAGSYDPGQIPGAVLPERERSDVLAYGSAPRPKAAAFRLVGGQGSRLFIVTEAASQHAAEEQALKACNNDPIQSNRQSPCFLYAVGNQVVLPQWFREPVARGNKQ
jgi:hypothetical protein